MLAEPLSLPTSRLQTTTLEDKEPTEPPAQAHPTSLVLQAVTVSQALVPLAAMASQDQESASQPHMVMLAQAVPLTHQDHLDHMEQSRELPPQVPQVLPAEFHQA